MSLPLPASSQNSTKMKNHSSLLDIPCTVVYCIFAPCSSRLGFCVKVRIIFGTVLIESNLLLTEAYLIANKTQNILVFRNSTVYGLLLGQCRDSDYSLLLGQCRDIDYYWDSVEMSYSIHSISQPV